MHFINYNTYLFESQSFNNIQYLFRYEQNNKVVRILALSDDQTIGYINPWHYIKTDWEIVAVAAEHGYGYKMHEASMDFLYPSWIIPARNKSIQPELFRTYEKFIDRPDIESLEITSDDPSYVKISKKYSNWFNRRYRLKNKLNLNFIETDYRFMNKTWNKFFSEKYPWASRNRDLR